MSYALPNQQVFCSDHKVRPLYFKADTIQGANSHFLPYDLTFTDHLEYEYEFFGADFSSLHPRHPDPTKEVTQSLNALVFGASPIFAVATYNNPFAKDGFTKIAANSYFKTFTAAEDAYYSNAAPVIQTHYTGYMHVNDNEELPVKTEKDGENVKKRKLDV